MSRHPYTWQEFLIPGKLYKGVGFNRTSLCMFIGWTSDNESTFKRYTVLLENGKILEFYVISNTRPDFIWKRVL